MVLSTWSSEGVIQGTKCMLAGAVRRALGQEACRRSFPWADENVVAGLFEPYGFDVTVEHSHFAVTASSLDEYFEAEFLEHPYGVAGRAVLEAAGQEEQTMERVRAALFYANEHPTRFRITSPYAVVTAQRR
jgi:hypothetical protein